MARRTASSNLSMVTRMAALRGGRTSESTSANPRRPWPRWRGACWSQTGASRSPCPGAARAGAVPADWLSCLEMGDITRVAIVGAGTMGSQIALQTAYAGHHHVALVDSNAQQLEIARAQNERLTRRGVERGRLTEERAADALGRIHATTDLPAAVAGAELVVEAAFEEIGRASCRE